VREGRWTRDRVVLGKTEFTTLNIEDTTGSTSTFNTTRVGIVLCSAIIASYNTHAGIRRPHRSASDERSPLEMPRATTHQTHHLIVEACPINQRGGTILFFNIVTLFPRTSERLCPTRLWDQLATTGARSQHTRHCALYQQVSLLLPVLCQHTTSPCHIARKRVHSM
jgi:hypothetical protein